MFVSFLDTIRHTSDGALSVDQLKQATVLVPNQSSNGEEEDESGSGDSERSQQELSPECLMRLLNVAQVPRLKIESIRFPQNRLLSLEAIFSI